MVYERVRGWTSGRSPPAICGALIYTRAARGLARIGSITPVVWTSAVSCDSGVFEFKTSSSSKTQGQLGWARNVKTDEKKIWPKKSQEREEELFFSFLTFFARIFCSSVLTFLAPTNYPWVSDMSEDKRSADMLELTATNRWECRILRRPGSVEILEYKT